ncbi:rRNA maturation RNase YbeY [Enterobacteriaceae endosymbiont of Plateumaris consimilis]|uniref:rRNA maturation RNase YbeY n=1 Tax=Enterobacteriaceae endosymbiont of Plateumaris consimilis TaxID=2675794 RepID=UPI001449253C|nr:rRNA maturation RNase YbeY [Enterobacteriaceae endosymbiont of Plateumaris consimilis]QJC28705.1 rRNA maturation RNase YbeY [Enterobacteriaceae endosymbiont of Plateumaris consimilis]
MKNILLNYNNYCKNKNNLPLKSNLYNWLYIIFNNYKKKFIINISIVEKKIIKKLNMKFLSMNKTTNVLCFPYEDYLSKKFFLGDIILCKDIIEYEAYMYNKKIEEYWAHMIIHSSLHLLKFDHFNNKKTKIMQLEEIKLLTLLGYSNPYK